MRRLYHEWGLPSGKVRNDAKIKEEVRREEVSIRHLFTGSKMDRIHFFIAS